MALFNYATKEITLKVVYYGPGLSGKTTNLQQLHSSLDSQKTGKLLSLATETDRTLFFDFLPVELGKVKDFSIRFQLYTVPGQVKYNATRKVVLKGADAVVFVADSQREMKEANIESFNNMRENLLSNNINPDDISLVLQYNKRDLTDILSIDELNKDLNSDDQVYLEAEAINGKGVQETFQTITKLLIKDIARKHKLEIQPAAPSEKPVSAISETIIEQPVEEKRIPLEEPAQPILSFEEQTVEKEEILIEEPLQPPASLQVPAVEEEFVFAEEPAQPPPPLQQPAIEEEFTIEEFIQPPAPEPPQEIVVEREEEKEPAVEEEFVFAEEPVQPSVPAQEPALEYGRVQETIIKEIPMFPTEELNKIRASIKEIPIFPVEKFDKITDSVKETNQLLISLKVAIKELSDELKKSREEQKEMLTIIREMKISETVEKLKGRKKKGWFS